MRSPWMQQFAVNYNRGTMLEVHLSRHENIHLQNDFLSNVVRHRDGSAWDADCIVKKDIRVALIAQWESHSRAECSGQIYADSALSTLISD